MKRSVLCIDDSNTALLLLEYALNEAGFQALLALSVQQALNIIENKKPDLILLDLSMPEISGYEFLGMLEKPNLKNVPVIVISAFDSQDSISTTLKLGALDFISKPIRIDDIVKRITKVLEH